MTKQKSKQAGKQAVREQANKQHNESCTTHMCPNHTYIRYTQPRNSTRTRGTITIMLLYLGGGRTVAAMTSLPQAAGGASSSGLASTSSPWITAGWCQLCEIEASSVHFGGKRHKKSLASDPLSWKHAWSSVPEVFLVWAARDAADPAASAAVATAAAQSEAVR